MGYKRISGRPTDEQVLDTESIAFGGEMKAGKELAQIEAVELTETKAVVKFKNSFNEHITSHIFLQDFNKTDVSYLMKQLVAAAAEDATELFELVDNPKALPNVVGRTVLLTIENSEGLKLINTSKGFKAGQYSASTLTELVTMLAEDGQKLERPIVASIQGTEGVETPAKKTTTNQTKRNSRQDF
jgi:hypothetical protein